MHAYQFPPLLSSVIIFNKVIFKKVIAAVIDYFHCQGGREELVEVPSDCCPHQCLLRGEMERKFLSIFAKKGRNVSPSLLLPIEEKWKNWRCFPMIVVHLSKNRWKCFFIFVAVVYIQKWMNRGGISPLRI